MTTSKTEAKPVEAMTSDELRAKLDGASLPATDPEPAKAPKAKAKKPAKAHKAKAKKPAKAPKAKAKKPAKAPKAKVKKAPKAKKPNEIRESKTLEIARFMCTTGLPHLTTALAKKFKVRLVQIRRAALMIERLGGKVRSAKSDKATGKPGRRAFVFTVTKSPSAFKK